jgi:integrase
MRKDRDGLYKQPESPNWYASYTGADGKRCRRSTGTDSYREAQLILGHWRAEARRNQGTPPMTLQDVILAYIDAHSNKRSLNRDVYSLKHLYDIIGEHSPINSLTTGKMVQYQLQRQAEGAKPATINKELGFLSACLNWAKTKQGWKVENVAAGHRLPEPPGRQRWLSRAEAAQLIEAAKQEPQAPHLADFILLALHTGMRCGELLGLAWKRVDFQKNRILLEQQKNGKPGMVPFNQTARNALLSLANFRATHCPASLWVFCDRQGRRISSIKKSFASAVRRAEIEHCTIHDLRRTFGSWLVQAGVHIQHVSKLLRHSDIRITDRVYAHLQPEQLHQAVAVLDSCHSGVIVEMESGGQSWR